MNPGTTWGCDGVASESSTGGEDFDATECYRELGIATSVRTTFWTSRVDEEVRIRGRTGGGGGGDDGEEEEKKALIGTARKVVESKTLDLSAIEGGSKISVKSNRRRGRRRSICTAKSEEHAVTVGDVRLAVASRLG